LSPELVEANVSYCLREVMVLEHARHVEILNHHDCLGFRQPRSELMQRVGPLIRHTAMQFAEALRRLATIVAAFGLARDRALTAFELLQARS
jgi:hypothetical protein